MLVHYGFRQLKSTQVLIIIFKMNYCTLLPENLSTAFLQTTFRFLTNYIKSNLQTKGESF